MIILLNTPFTRPLWGLAEVEISIGNLFTSQLGLCKPAGNRKGDNLAYRPGVKLSFRIIPSLVSSGGEMVGSWEMAGGGKGGGRWVGRGGGLRAAPTRAGWLVLVGGTKSGVRKTTMADDSRAL